MSTKCVLLPEKIDSSGVNYLNDRGYDLRYCENTPASILANIKDCHAIITRNAPITADILHAAPLLRVVARHGAGVDIIDLEAAREKNIWVTYAPESNVNAVAEQALGGMLALARRLPLCDSMVRHGRFDERTTIRGNELQGRTLGFVGFGKIGQRFAKIASLGLDMNIAYYDPYLKKDGFPFNTQRMQTLNELLSISDVVSVHLPLTDSTRYIIDQPQFHAMKRNSLLLNYARGALVNTEALINALKEGRIAGAAIDVYEVEPPPVDHPLYSLPNVVLSPHTAAFTEEGLRNMSVHAAMTVDDVLSEREPSWFVVKPKV